MFSDCHAHHKCIQDALITAEKICNENGSRLTKLRKRVLEMIWNSHEPVKAYDLLTELQKEESSAKPSTVYRTLDFLQLQGLVHKLHRSNSYIGCNTPQENNPFFSLICSGCNQLIECHDEAYQNLITLISKTYNFSVTQATLELEGVCKNCFVSSYSTDFNKVDLI